MPRLPESVSKAWDNRNEVVIFATVDRGGHPNAIYATCVGKFDEDTLVLADNYLDKTRRNALDGSKGAMLFMTKDKKAFQVKGSLTYHRAGPIFDAMKRWNPSQHPGHAAVALSVEEVYAGKEKLL
jgi:predicted pyridoxine 5'-phosphate oxidase superfamily flavin-nucleotide-binding protein